ncbi:MAG: hypothetical protein WC779_07990, partial [Candidatus Omnitrophota bacterium]
MANFSYKAKKGLTDTVDGVIEADSQEDALARLVRQGLFPISVQLIETAAGAKAAKARKGSRLHINLLGKKKVTVKEVLVFTQKLTTLSRAKVELLSSIK